MGRFFVALWVVLAGPVLRADVGTITIGGPHSPDGKVVVAVDLPVEQRIKNIGSKKDGAGMCVFSSNEMSMRWANLEAWRGWRDWCAARYPGGGYPQKVDDLIKAYAKFKKIPIPDYIQYEGRDATVLEAAIKTGRLPSITYCGRDQHYNGKSVAHMTNLVYLDQDWACVLDNNFIGSDELVWMTRKEFIERWQGNGGGWCVIYLSAPPPPVPHN